MNELDQRLQEWRDAYAGGKYEHLGYPSHSAIHNAIIYHGPAPQGLNPRSVSEHQPADDVEMAVAALEKQGPFGFRCGQALRAEYWLQHAPEKERIDSLREIGVQLSRTSYYEAIRTARIHVAAWLRISLA